MRLVLEKRGDHSQFFAIASPFIALLLTLIAGLIVAAGGAVLLAFACDHFDPSLKTPQDIENDLGIPVLFSVPRNDRHALLQN